MISLGGGPQKTPTSAYQELQAQYRQKDCQLDNLIKKKQFHQQNIANLYEKYKCIDTHSMQGEQLRIRLQRILSEMESDLRVVRDLDAECKKCLKELQELADILVANMSDDIVKFNRKYGQAKRFLRKLEWALAGLVGGAGVSCIMVKRDWISEEKELIFRIVAPLYGAFTGLLLAYLREIYERKLIQKDQLRKEMERKVEMMVGINKEQLKSSWFNKKNLKSTGIYLTLFILPSCAVIYFRKRK